AVKQRRSSTNPQPATPQFGGLEQAAFSTAISPDGRLVVSAAFRVEINDGGLKTQVDYLELASGRKRLQFETRTDIVNAGGVDFGSVMSALHSFIAACVFAPD